MDDRAVGGDVPGGEADPGLALGVERDLEALFPEGGQVGGRNDLSVGLGAITPDDLDELQREIRKGQVEYLVASP